MKLNIEALMGADRPEQWATYREDFELKIVAADADEQLAWLNSRKGQSDTRAIDRDYWLGHVTDWRGLTDTDGKPVPFDADLLRALWRRDFRLVPWIMEACQDIDRFLYPHGDAAPVPVGAPGAAA